MKRVFIKNLSTPMSRNRAESFFAQGNFSWNSQVFEVCGWSPGGKKDIIHLFSYTTELNRGGKPSTKSVSLKNRLVNAFFVTKSGQLNL